MLESLSKLSKLEKCYAGSCALAGIANLFLVIGTLTPAWQVAEDTDNNRYVQSGLWLYCSGYAQCWYFFSDNLINYYEKVDVCRFLLLGDCRKKLLRTPYFFGWHYAVFALNAAAIFFTCIACTAALLGYLKGQRRLVAAIVFDVFVSLAVLILGISLVVFVTNAEMLESKYLIGINSTYEKHYGYSFYLACLALFMLSLSAFGATLLTIFTFLKTKSMPRRDTPSSTGTPSSVQLVPPTNLYRSDYLAPAHVDTGGFQQKTRYFYSY